MTQFLQIRGNEIELTVGVVSRLQFHVRAVLALLAVTVENEDLLVGELELAHDSRRIELSVENDCHADFAVLLASQLLTSILERGAPGVLAYLEVAVTLDGDFAGLVVLLVARAANKSRSYLKCVFFFILFL